MGEQTSITLLTLRISEFLPEGNPSAENLGAFQDEVCEVSEVSEDRKEGRI